MIDRLDISRVTNRFALLVALALLALICAPAFANAQTGTDDPAPVLVDEAPPDAEAPPAEPAPAPPPAEPAPPPAEPDPAPPADDPDPLPPPSDGPDAPPADDPPPPDDPPVEEEEPVPPPSEEPVDPTPPVEPVEVIVVPIAPAAPPVTVAPGDLTQAPPVSPDQVLTSTASQLGDPIVATAEPDTIATAALPPALPDIAPTAGAAPRPARERPAPVVPTADAVTNPLAIAAGLIDPATNLFRATGPSTAAIDAAVATIAGAVGTSLDEVVNPFAQATSVAYSAPSGFLEVLASYVIAGDGGSSASTLIALLQLAFVLVLLAIVRPQAATAPLAPSLSDFRRGFRAVVLRPG